MRFNRPLILGCLLVGLFAQSQAQAVDCSVSYYCYRSMTPGPAPRETTNTPAPNRIQTTNTGDRIIERPGSGPSTAATQPQSQPTNHQLTAEQRQRQQAEEQRRRQQQLEQQRQQQIAAQQRQQQQAQEQQRRQQQLEQQRQQQIAAQQRQQQAQEQQRRQQQTEAQRRQQQQTEEQRRQQEQQRLAQQLRTDSNQSCENLNMRIAEIERQAIINARDRQHDQSRRLFAAVADMREQAKRQNCAPI